MKSFVSRANILTQAKKQTEAAKAVSDGLQYYSNNVIKACLLYTSNLFHGDCVFVITRICIIARTRKKCKCESQMQERRLMQMSNTTVPISEWCKEIRVALARKEMNLQSVADEIGYSYTTITALISGRIVKDNYLDIAKKINEVLEVNVLPEKPQLPSDEWCGAVRAKLYVKKMNISELSKSIGFNRDKVSLVLNGHALDWPVIEKINEQLKVEVPAVPVGTD